MMVKKTIVLAVLCASAMLNAQAQSNGPNEEKNIEQMTTEEMIELSLEELLNMPVSIASKFSEKLSDAPGIISVLSKDEISRFGGTKLKDILERVPGLISSTVPYSNRTTMVARGNYIKQNSSHLLFLINGRPIREIQEGGVSSELLNTFPVNIIETIEVIKGPGSVLYGSDAFSGVINVITSKVEKTSASITGLYQNGGGYKATTELLAKLKNDFSIVAAAQANQNAIWKAPYHTQTFEPSADPPYFIVKDTTITLNIPDKGFGGFLNANYHGFTLNTTYNQWNTLGTQLFNNVQNTKYFLNLGYHTDITNNWSMDANLTYARAKLFGENLSERDSRNIVAELTNNISFSDKLRLIVGGLFNSNKGKEMNIQDPENITTISSGSRNGIVLYSQIDYRPHERVKLIAGAQANKYGDLKMSIVPRAGIILSATKRITVKTLYSEAYRAPSINELYMNFPQGLYGDENLKPERVATFEMGVSYQGTKSQFGVSFFRSKMKDIIVPEFVDPMTSFDRKYTNLQSVTYLGGEFESKYYINNNFYLVASALYQVNESEDVENVAPIANFGFKSGISYRSDKGFMLSLFDLYQGDLDDKYIGQNNPHQGAYNLLHFHSEYELNSILNFHSKAKFTIILNVDNVLDRKVYMYDWGGFSNDAIPANQGRLIYSGVKVTF